MKVSGTLRWNDLEGGIWELHADDGRRFLLNGPLPKAVKDGLRLEVSGSIDEETMGFGMTGEILKVSQIRILE